MLSDALELNGAHRLPELDVKRALASRLEQACDLHGDGRAAGDDVPMGDELQRGAAEGERIDAVMLPRSACPHRPKATSKKRGSTCSVRRRQPPAALARDVGPKQLPVAVENGLRHFEVAPERRRTERVDQSPQRADRHADHDHQAGECIDRIPLPPALGREGAARRFGVRGLTPLRSGDAGSCSPTRGSGELAARLELRWFIWRPAPRPCRCRCGRSGRDGTCPRPQPAAAHSLPAIPPAPRRPR